ncbi:mechanosensitive ion channel family protein [Candidatus Uhrbacteria bacterium]|nr:mechanosensitive ion channel family protein [Candidatus Uhrbacteria bacterium]
MPVYFSFEHFDAAVRIGGIILFTIVSLWLFSFFVQHVLSAVMRIHRLKARDKRIKTIGRVIGSTGYFVIVLVAGVMILQQLRIDASPILASAGIAGLAVSFGAQSLLKDVFSGLCILMEDQYGVGDSVMLDDVSGTVEELSLRKTVLLDAEGNRAHVPHGQVRIVRVESRNPKL